jgi:hypothetical protein
MREGDDGRDEAEVSTRRTRVAWQRVDDSVDPSERLSLGVYC